jgi:hypothetical protein
MNEQKTEIYGRAVMPRVVLFVLMRLIYGNKLETRYLVSYAD